MKEVYVDISLLYPYRTSATYIVDLEICRYVIETLICPEQAIVRDLTSYTAPLYGIR